MPDNDKKRQWLIESEFILPIIVTLRLERCGVRNQ